MAQEWFYAKDGERHGPISSQQLKELAATGELLATDLVWTDGRDEWKPASKIKGLFPEEPVPPPVVSARIVRETQSTKVPPPRTSVQQPSAKSSGLSGQQKTMLSILGGGSLLMFLCCGGCGVLGMIGSLFDSPDQVSNFNATDDIVMQGASSSEHDSTETNDDDGTGNSALDSLAQSYLPDQQVSEDPSVDFNGLDFESVNFALGPQGQEVIEERNIQNDGDQLHVVRCYKGLDGNRYLHGEQLTVHKLDRQLGQPSKAANYVFGRKHGLFRIYAGYEEWYANGDLRRKTWWLPATGRFPRFKSKEEHFLNGKAHGTATSWYEPGKPMQETHYVDGKKHGWESSWDPSGSLDSKVRYENGKEAETSLEPFGVR